MLQVRDEVFESKPPFRGWHTRILFDRDTLSR